MFNVPSMQQLFYFLLTLYRIYHCHHWRWIYIFIICHRHFPGHWSCSSCGPHPAE
jgi:hypothetical protein